MGLNKTSSNSERNTVELSDYELTIQNLIILKEHWEERKDSVKLRMDSFGGINHIPYKREFSKPMVHDCGTCCCVLGLSPEVLEVIPEHYGYRGFNYDCFGRTHFPYLYNSSEEKIIWKYLFSWEWHNDIEHALKRMQKVIDGEITDKLTKKQYNKKLKKAIRKYNRKILDKT